METLLGALLMSRGKCSALWFQAVVPREAIISPLHYRPTFMMGLLINALRQDRRLHQIWIVSEGVRANSRGFP